MAEPKSIYRMSIEELELEVERTRDFRSDCYLTDALLQELRTLHAANDKRNGIGYSYANTLHRLLPELLARLEKGETENTNLRTALRAIRDRIICAQCNASAIAHRVLGEEPRD